MNKEWIPNTLTLSNGFFGFMSVIMTSNSKFLYASVFIIFAVLADRYDGIVARKLNIVSEIGKQLDSLCDALSFGVAPAFLIFTKTSTSTEFISLAVITAVICGVYTCCGIFRLARFNITTMADGYYTGVPITTCGCILAVLSMFNSIPNFALVILTVILAYLMVSTIKIKKI